MLYISETLHLNKQFFLYYQRYPIFKKIYDCMRKKLFLHLTKYVPNILGDIHIATLKLLSRVNSCLGLTRSQNDFERSYIFNLK